MTLPDIKNCKRIAVMGGTFDPIHNGHLAIAEAVRHRQRADRVVFIPSGRPPHKAGAYISHSEHRYLMTVLATASNPYFLVSRLELERPGLSYTVDTIAELRAECRKDAKIFFITGADAVSQILTWKNPERLLGLCSFVAVTRPGYARDDLNKQIANVKKACGGKISVQEAPALAISSTELRQRARSGQPMKYLVPDEVEEYIAKHCLYRESWGLEPSEIAELDAALRKNLSDKRYIHTLGVAETAVKLAQAHGADVGAAHVAALLHDMAKEIPAAEKLRLCERYGLKPDGIMKKQPDLVHGALGAEIARKKYGVKDKDVLNAISFHTTGRPGMSVLEKIVFLADAVEPNRPGYGEVPGLREQAFADIDTAVITSLESTMNYTAARGKAVHPLGKEALEWMLGQIGGNGEKSRK